MNVVLCREPNTLSLKVSKLDKASVLVQESPLSTP